MPHAACLINDSPPVAVGQHEAPYIYVSGGSCGLVVDSAERLNPRRRGRTRWHVVWSRGAGGEEGGRGKRGMWTFRVGGGMRKEGLKDRWWNAKTKEYNVNDIFADPIVRYVLGHYMF